MMLRKIVNLLLSEIVRIHKDFLRKTKKKYLDMLKPESNKKKFFIIHCFVNDIEGVPKNHVNIIVDWLAHIHDYASSKIHLCNIKGLPELFKLIANNLENLEKQEIIDYLMKPYETKNIADYYIKNVCEKIKGNDSQNSMEIENNIQELKKEKDTKNEHLSKKKKR